MFHHFFRIAVFLHPQETKGPTNTTTRLDYKTTIGIQLLKPYLSRAALDSLEPREKMQTSAIPTGTTPDKLVLDPHWTATATKSIYNASLADARLHAARGEHDSFSAGSIATLHLLNAVDEIQYQASHNEIRFLESRYSQRIAEALAASSQGEQKDDLWPDLIEYATSGQKIPTLNPGERYAGIALDDTGKATHHLILLPQITEVRLNWDDAMAWAEVVRGALAWDQGFGDGGQGDGDKGYKGRVRAVRRFLID